MANSGSEGSHKTRIESLSDLIFGLALSIGALTLIGKPPSNLQELIFAIVFYGFSFLILISVWYSYTRTMSLLNTETPMLLSLNVLLLFLVTIEPFLFDQLFHASVSLVEDVSIVYALDLGGLFAVQAFFAQSIIGNKSSSEFTIRLYKLRRNTLLLTTAFFFLSIVPIFWTLSIQINGAVSMPLRIIFWLIPILLPAIRRIWEKRLER
jgi:uncharacterized membrane protein